MQASSPVAHIDQLLVQIEAMSRLLVHRKVVQQVDRLRGTRLEVDLERKRVAMNNISML